MALSFPNAPEAAAVGEVSFLIQLLLGSKYALI
jgi:hypothetical protein